MSDLKSLSDEALITLLQQGDIQAFDEVYYRYWPKLYAAAYKRLRSREVSEELVQDFFTSLWINRQTLVIHTHLANYVYTAIRYLVLNAIQKEHVRKGYQQVLKVSEPHSSNDTEETVTLNELTGALQTEVDRLPPKCRNVFELSRNEHKTTKEIASSLQISEKTVENHLTKALRILRLHLKDFVTAILLTVLS